MKRSIVIFVLAVMVLISLGFWVLNTQLQGNITEILMVVCAVIVIGFAVYVGIVRLKSKLQNEPPEDELSRSIMTRASSLSFYISIYWWLFLMYISDKISLETHSLIGAGIMGMAVIFLLSWIGVKFIRLKNE